METPDPTFNDITPDGKADQSATPSLVIQAPNLGMVTPPSGFSNTAHLRQTLAPSPPTANTDAGYALIPSTLKERPSTRESDITPPTQSSIPTATITSTPNPVQNKTFPLSALAPAEFVAPTMPIERPGYLVSPFPLPRSRQAKNFDDHVEWIRYLWSLVPSIVEKAKSNDLHSTARRIRGIWNQHVPSQRDPGLGDKVHREIEPIISGTSKVADAIRRENLCAFKSGIRYYSASECFVVAIYNRYTKDKLIVQIPIKDYKTETDAFHAAINTLHQSVKKGFDVPFEAPSEEVVNELEATKGFPEVKDLPPGIKYSNSHRGSPFYQATAKCRLTGKRRTKSFFVSLYGASAYQMALEQREQWMRDPSVTVSSSPLRPVRNKVDVNSRKKEMKQPLKSVPIPPLELRPPPPSL